MVKTRSQIELERLSQERDHERNTSEEGGAEEQKLGRGCRIRRISQSFDDMYLQSLYGVKPKPAVDAPFIIHERYPRRDAATRALSRTKEIWIEDSNSEQFVFRHHPESSEQLHISEDDEKLSSDSSAEPVKTKRQRSSNVVTPSPQLSSLSLKNKSKRARSVGTNSSVSDVSLRRETDSSSDSEQESGSWSDASEPYDLLKEDYQHSLACAKDSVTRNVDMNHYLPELIGKKDERVEAKKKLDRRFRHLFCEEKREKRTDASAGPSGGLGDVSPLVVDPSVTFESVGGLPQHIVTLREMVLFPLFYPDLLAQFGLRPPRGVLFVGPPGTGKTLMARALASEGSRAGGTKITFFMRKGADILSKWVGESERQLSLLFEEAKAKKPSIIFFDEIDGLVPVRHAKTEQSHAALVATFLALMDGLEDRGQVVVIGATNRPDTIDPALRRPGRFDRELFFPYPSPSARKHVLQIVAPNTLSAGDSSPRADILEDLVAMTEGFSGADLQALCVEAGLNRLRASLPQLYTTSDKLRVPSKSQIIVTKEDFFVAVRRIQPSMYRNSGESHGIQLPESWEYLLRGIREDVLQILVEVWPTARKVLMDESMDCKDLAAAVRQLSMFPVPYVKSPFLLILEAPTASSVESVAVNVSMCVIKSFSSFRVRIVHMLHVRVDFDYMSTPEVNSEGFTYGHLFDLVAYVKRCAPCVVLLQGMDEWLSVHGYTVGGQWLFSQERERCKKAWDYYMNSLSQTEALFLVPTCNSANVKKFLETGERLSSGHSVAPQHEEVIASQEVKIPCKASRAQIHKYVQYMHRIFLASLLRVETPELFSVQRDSTPHISKVKSSDETSLQQRQQIMKLQRKIEYRRLQLRHVLSKWVTQYVSSGKYKVLLSQDLDLTADDPLLKSWQRHTARSRIGLNDVLDKIEQHRYVCVSQYLEDIDLLVRNIRSFFRSRSSADMKYRLKALDLKESTMLGMFKLNRSILRFCEDYKDFTEPSWISDDEDDQDSLLATPKKTSATAEVKPRRAQIYWGKRRRKKKARQEKTLSQDVSIMKVEERVQDDVRELTESEDHSKGDEVAEQRSTSLLHQEPNRPIAQTEVSMFDIDNATARLVELLVPHTIIDLHNVFQKTMVQLQQQVDKMKNDEAGNCVKLSSDEVLNFMECCVSQCLNST